MIESVITLRPRPDWPTRIRPLVQHDRPGLGEARPATGVARAAGADARGALARSGRRASHARLPDGHRAADPHAHRHVDHGVRTPVGIKVFGEDLKEIERVMCIARRLAAPGAGHPQHVRRAADRPRASISSRTEAIARYGLTVRDVQDVGAAVGGMSVSTAIAGRARFSINLRYAADQRSDPQALRRILVPVQASGSVGGSRRRQCRRRRETRPAAW